MTKEERSQLIARYKEGNKRVTEALREITPEELDFKIAPDKWSCREVVQHLADSESISGHRLKRLLVEFSPYIQGYDQDEYARRFRYARRAIEPALEVFRCARQTTAELFDLMTEEDWKRQGEHSDSGPYSVESWLKIYAAHAHQHAEQIQRNRASYKKGRQEHR